MIKVLNIGVTLLLFMACKNSYQVYTASHSHSSVKPLATAKPYDTKIEPYRLKLSAQMNQTVVITTAALTKDKSESTLGNFVTDAMFFLFDSLRQQTDLPLVLMNRGGMRASLPQGTVTVGHIFELMPFDNELVILSLSGEELKSVFKRIIEKQHAFKNAFVKVNAGDTLIQLNGTTLVAQNRYTVLTSDYLANGGDGFSTLANANQRRNYNVKLRDAILLYCKNIARQNKLLEPYTNGHFSISN